MIVTIKPAEVEPIHLFTPVWRAASKNFKGASYVYSRYIVKGFLHLRVHLPGRHGGKRKSTSGKGQPDLHH